MHCLRCTKRGNYKTPSGERYCHAHAPEEAKSTVKHAVCEQCTLRARYGLDRPVRCKAHKEAGMTDRSGKRCKHKGCKTRPSYGYIGRAWCKRHAPEDTVSKDIHQCEYPGCTKSPSFGLAGRKALSCKAHMQEGYVDVMHKRKATADSEPAAKRAKA